jgi:hypothetical protein
MTTIHSVLVHKYLVSEKILCHLYGQDLLSLHKSNLFDCTKTMKKELGKLNPFIEDKEDEYVVILYEIYYKGRMKLEYAIIIALEYPNFSFTDFFLFSSYLVTGNYSITGKIVKAAARLDKLNILAQYSVLFHDEYIGSNQIGSLIAYGAGESGNLRLINHRYYESFIVGASRGGHVDIVENMSDTCLLDNTTILSHAFRGGSWNIIQKYNINLFTYFHHQFLYRAAKGGHVFLIDFINTEHDKYHDETHYKSLENRKSIELDGYIVGGHVHLLPLNYKYNLGHLSVALKYGRINIAKFIIDRIDISYPLLLNYLQSHHLELIRDEWPEVSKYINELVENDRNSKLFLKHKYGFGTKFETNWVIVEKEMELADGNITKAAMYAVKEQNIDRMTFYCHAGADKQILFSETQKLNNVIYTNKLVEALLKSKSIL